MTTSMWGEFALIVVKRTGSVNTADIDPLVMTTHPLIIDV